MTSLNPLSASTMDQKPREPSMEEILASIRRIIADDQAFTRPGLPPERPAAPLEETSRPSPDFVREAVPARHYETPAEAAFHREVATHEPMEQAAADYDRTEGRSAPRDPMHQHGSITPQFAAPPALEDQPSAFGPVIDEATSAPPMWRDPTPAADREAAPSEAPRSSPLSPAVTSPIDALPFHEEEEPDEAHETPVEHEGSSAPQDAPSLFSSATDTAVSSAFNMLAATRLADNSDELKAMVREMIRPLLRSWLDDNLPTMVERMVRAEIERVARGGR